MAGPKITIHDGAGDEITAGNPLALLTATPATATTPDTVLTVRNNDAGGPAVDPAPNFRLLITARLAGATGEPQADELAYLVSRSLQAQVTEVSGGADATIRSYVPLGTARTLALGLIPDGAVVTLGFRTLAPLSATIQPIEIFLSWESIESLALEDGYYETHGNWIYNGDGGGQPDPLFTEILGKAGALDPGAFDDTVGTWTEVRYVLEGVDRTTTPAVPELTFDDLDGAGAPVPLVAGEAYVAGIFLDGSDVFVVEDGLKGVAPLSEADRPATPTGTVAAGYVTVPFGLAIDTTEDVLTLGFFGLEVVSGLNVRIGGGQAAVSGRWRNPQTPTTVLLADDSSLRIFVQPEAGLEVIDASSSPIDPQSMWIWEVTTAAGIVTSITSRRRIGIRTIAGELAGATFILDAAVANDQTVHVTLVDGIGIPVSVDNHVVHCKLTDFQDGFGESTKIPDTVTVGASPQGFIPLGGTLNHFFLESDLDQIDVTFNENTGGSGDTYHLAVFVDDIVMAVSPAITPKP